jgi:hypothetical protein
MSADRNSRIHWGDLLLASISAVSWAFLAMAGTAALGLHLIGADGAGSLGPMTAAAMVLAVGGRITPSGDVGVFGLEGAEAKAAIDIAPLGVGLVGALLLAWLFLRSLRTAGPLIGARELAARTGTVALLFLALLGGLAWAGNDTVTIDEAALGLDELPDGGLPDGLPGGLPDEIADQLPDGLGDFGDIGGGLPDRLADLAAAEARVGFEVDTVASLLGGAVWVAGVLLIALLASRRTPLPPGWSGVHRLVRPAASALCTMLVVAVAAGLAAAAYSAITGDQPRRVMGAALLGTPNGVWLGIPLGLFVPWRGRATGELAGVLPDPLDRLLTAEQDQPITVGRLAELDGRVWLLAVATALAMLCAGVLTAVRTPLPGGGRTLAGALGCAGRCAVPLGVVTALALPLLVRLTEVSADASLSLFGFDAFGAGIELRGSMGMALLLGAVWGAGAGALGAVLAYGAGVAGRRAHPFALARGGPGGAGRSQGFAGARTYPDIAYRPGPYSPSPVHRSARDETNPYLRPGPASAAPTPPAADPSSAPTVSGVPPQPVPRPGPRRARPAEGPPDEPPPPGSPRAPHGPGRR